MAKATTHKDSNIPAQTLKPVLLGAGEEKKRRKDEIDGNHHKNRDDHGLRRRAPNFFGSSSGGKPFVTTHGRDGNAEHYALDQAGRDVPQQQRVE